MATSVPITRTWPSSASAAVASARAWLLAALLGLAGCASTPAPTGPVLSPAATIDEAGMVDLRALVPDLSQEIRYFGSENFVGAPVDGYQAPRCWLKREAALALARVEAALRARHQRLRVYDCYRPARAVAHFMRWVEDPNDVATKPRYYPELDKSALPGVYIGRVSGHSRGATVDLTLLQCDARGADCRPLDMGTAFDFFGSRANTDSPLATPAQRANRHALRDALASRGFHNYPMEWWHYTYRPEPTPTLLYDVPVTAPEEPMPLAAIDRLMQAYDGNVPGASLLVLRDGRAVVSRGYGRSDLAQGIEAGPATNYRLASLSKQFTAAAILLLAQEGALALDDPARRWLPALPPATAAVTLRHLLSHTSGIPDYEDLMAVPYAGQITDAGVLALLAGQDRLLFPAGSAYRYSNSGYALLALVVERASRQPFSEFLRNRIFLPLGMHRTLAYVPGGAEVPHRAWGHSQAGDGWERTDQSATSAVLGDGGIYSSIDDLARWDAALYDDRLLSDASRALAFGVQARVADEPGVDGYGFGWRVQGGLLWHSGETIGFRNVILRWPAERLTVVLLSNRNAPAPYATAMRIAELFRGE